MTAAKRLTNSPAHASYGAYMKPVLITLFLLSSVALAQTSYQLSIYANGSPLEFTLMPPAERTDTGFTVPEGTERVTVSFNSGTLDLNIADWQVFDYAHVLGINVSTRAAGTYTVAATVRHRDEGWEHYADAFEVSAADDTSNVTNGLRILTHPHDTEQPFTRSQSSINATGSIRVHARDNIHGEGGSVITLDLTQPSVFPYELTYDLTQLE